MANEISWWIRRNKHRLAKVVFSNLQFMLLFLSQFCQEAVYIYALPLCVFCTGDFGTIEVCRIEYYKVDPIALHALSRKCANYRMCSVLATNIM